MVNEDACAAIVFATTVSRVKCRTIVAATLAGQSAVANNDARQNDPLIPRRQRSHPFGTMEPLTTGQQLFNQRLLAEHCLPEHKLLEIWKQLGEHEDMGGESLAETISGCNKQLRYIGLEIRCVAMKNPSYNSQASIQEDAGSVAAIQSNKKTVKYYTIVNAYPDEVGKKSFMNDMVPGEITYIKTVLENLIEDSQSLATLLNLRPDTDEEKLSLPNAETIIYKLLDAKWIEWASTRHTNSAPIQMAPRTYMELSHLLTEELGMEKESMPQVIIH